MDLNQFLNRTNLVGLAKLAAAAIVGGLTGWFWPDNPLEMAAEDYIQKETGIRIELPNQVKPQ